MKARFVMNMKRIKLHDEDIDDDERAALCLQIKNRTALECNEKVFGDKEGSIERELRLWYDDSWSGQLGLFLEAFDGVDALIADYKTLHGSHTPAPDNIQLLAQAVLYWKNYPKWTMFMWP